MIHPPSEEWVQCKTPDYVSDDQQDLAAVKTLQCRFCQIAFRFQSTLNIHEQNVHIRDQSFQCRLCAFSTHSESILKSHERTHTHCSPKSVHIEQRVQCHECLKSYSSIKYLQKHIRIVHAGNE